MWASCTCWLVVGSAVHREHDGHAGDSGAAAHFLHDELSPEVKYILVDQTLSDSRHPITEAARLVFLGTATGCKLMAVEVQ